MISDLEAANETMEESAELLGKSRRNELIEEMGVLVGLFAFSHHLCLRQLGIQVD